jgi:hydroxymethylpyrimidine kinase/phosphomethylpyrimidine kinase
MTVIATVGTTHPLAFAGLIFNALALADDGARAVCVVAGVSAQDAAHVTARTPIDAATIRAQFDALRDAGVEAFHVGALLSPEAVHAVAEGLRVFAGIPVVVDPVLAATGGDALADAATRTALREALIPLATLVTPNLAEAGALLNRTVSDIASMRAAAAEFVRIGAHAALIKGGHLVGDPTDVLAEGERVRELPSHRVAGTVRGSGDILAITIATCLARGASLTEAIEHARRRVRESIASATTFAGTRVATLFTNN